MSRLLPLIRLSPAGSTTPCRVSIAVIGRVLFGPDNTRLIEIRFGNRGRDGSVSVPRITVSDRFIDLRDAWPGYATLRTTPEEGGLECLVNCMDVIQVEAYTQDQMQVADKVAISLDGRAAPIVVAGYFGQVDSAIQAARQRIDDFLTGRTVLPETPEPGVVLR